MKHDFEHEGGRTVNCAFNSGVICFILLLHSVSKYVVKFLIILNIKLINYKSLLISVMKFS